MPVNFRRIGQKISNAVKVGTKFISNVGRGLTKAADTSSQILDAVDAGSGGALTSNPMFQKAKLASAQVSNIGHGASATTGAPTLAGAAFSLASAYRAHQDMKAAGAGPAPGSETAATAASDASQ